MGVGFVKPKIGRKINNKINKIDVFMVVFQELLKPWGIY
jgi:hypothetical protein